MAPSTRRLQFSPTPSHAVLIEVVQDACALLECRQPLDMCAAIRPVQELAALVPRMVRAERQESFGTQSCEELPAVEKPGLAPYQISVSACPLKAKNLDECCPPHPAAGALHWRCVWCCVPARTGACARGLAAGQPSRCTCHPAGMDCGWACDARLPCVTRLLSTELHNPCSLSHAAPCSHLPSTSTLNSPPCSTRRAG